MLQRYLAEIPTDSRHFRKVIEVEFINTFDLKDFITARQNENGSFRPCATIYGQNYNLLEKKFYQNIRK